MGKTKTKSITMTIITQEKLSMFCAHAHYINNKPAEERTTAEIAWMPWAEKRLAELEASK